MHPGVDAVAGLLGTGVFRKGTVQQAFNYDSFIAVTGAEELHAQVQLCCATNILGMSFTQNIY